MLHKESTFTPLEEKGASIVYGKNNDKSLASKISVYSKTQKDILIKSKIASEKQIIVNGCPRSDYSFELRKSKIANLLDLLLNLRAMALINLNFFKVFFIFNIIHNIISLF